MRKYLLILLLVLLAFVSGILSYRSCADSSQEQTIDARATILLERIRDVSKMVTVEGDVNELYNETRTRHVTLYIPLPAQFDFEKKATVEVTGTVLVGYDLEGLHTNIDEATKTVTISNLPEPEVLAVDHTVKYRLLEESWFNNFGPDDFSEINANARQLLVERVKDSELIDHAREEGLGILNTIEHIVRAAGYDFVLERAPVPADGRVEEVNFEG